ncbi:hypothetical protein C5167_009673 [Papaver somniferum]|uniref:FAR1 domain-containing protein n=1 Tax=Papaver somniferum TaxID=3469 RepID=A0A4Y7K1Z6_PAPSO|nr:hypothetical protein C5167_009673 [Papaver somniferum]
MRTLCSTGFSIRWHTTHKYRVETFEVIRRTFCCNRQRVRDPKSKPVEQRKRNHADIRANCNVAMVIVKKNSRLPAPTSIELDIANSQDKQQKKSKKSVALDNAKSQDKQPKKGKTCIA